MRYPKAAAFFAVFVLALAVFAGGGVYLAAGRDGCAVSGEVLAGDRSYAESFSVTQRAVVDGHLLINAGYLSADSGPGWSMADTAPRPGAAAFHRPQGHGPGLLGELEQRHAAYHGDPPALRAGHL